MYIRRPPAPSTWPPFAVFTALAALRGICFRLPHSGIAREASPSTSRCARFHLSSGTRSLPEFVSKKSLKFVIERTTNFRSELCVKTPTCGSSTFCGNASNRELTCGSSGYTSRPTYDNYGQIDRPQ